MRSVLALPCGLLLLSGIPSGETAAQTEPISVDVAPFRLVELRNGGKVTIRHGPAHRVTFLKGRPDETQLTIVSGDALVIEKRKRKGDRRYELEIEVLTPELDRVSVAQGGTIQSSGSFPRQAAIGVAVDNGGTIDIRSMSVGSITASVLSGGRIFAKPLTGLLASVVEGGNITYWGDATVRPSIEHGGVIVRGDPSDVDKPLSEVSPAIAPVSPLLPTAPIKTRRDLQR